MYFPPVYTLFFPLRHLRTKNVAIFAEFGPKSKNTGFMHFFKVRRWRMFQNSKIHSVYIVADLHLQQLLCWSPCTELLTSSTHRFWHFFRTISHLHAMSFYPIKQCTHKMEVVSCRELSARVAVVVSGMHHAWPTCVVNVAIMKEPGLPV